jgi:hypothetical protein
MCGDPFSKDWPKSCVFFSVLYHRISANLVELLPQVIQFLVFFVTDLFGFDVRFANTEYDYAH